MVETAGTAQNAALDARYGRTPNRKRRDRTIAIVAAALFVVVFAAWVLWAGLDNGQGNLNAQDIGHKVVDDSTVTITWQVSVSSGAPVSCALQAQNAAHAIVGWKIVELPASANLTRQYTETVRTSQRAVTGLIYRCWLT
ncbi:MAG: DUF4307 domain-containing protein [Cryobacterium sp.]|nr:DUF4307 domain-containing protein [Micrococcales bacterium]MBX3078435.1 DUF4307 domain-containing protein [Cryobacterium sp.]MBX3309866.1 DUF4307 domain-containing protein [Cryobacterium sp.]MCB1280359.1 DUF4307 domain-containing protein [Salinibacterium sp.]HNP15677.1 DUF4307 domain-containing protein [Terrimesophilobacter sp.]